jgi:valyl-tRNA synthetase
MLPFPRSYDRAAIERGLQGRWAKSKAFEWDASLPAELDYTIDTPPPTVSGTLHIGHVYSYTQADILARYFRMSGRNVLYPIGWDDNGLPTERLVEKVKKVRGGEMKRADFVALCREVIPTYEAEFRSLFSRLALSVDWTRQYQTISNESRQISQMSFLDLYEKGLLERRLEPTLWDPADRTALAQAEVDEIERESKLNFIVFRIEGGGEAIVATTRPELLAACGALMIHPGDARAAAFAGKTALSPLYNVRVPIITDDKVDPEKGSGIVMCCTFGDVTDIYWWRTHKLPLRIAVDRAGRMMSDLPIGAPDWPSADPAAAKATMAALAGLKVEKARATMLERLASAGLLRKQETVRQVVPVAERSGAPLEILVTPQWFIRTLDFKDQILAKGREIVWRPDFMRQRFESWVEGLRWDWAISRQRHFGVPLPVWYSKRPGELGKVILPSVDQLPVDPMVDLPKGYAEHEVEREPDVMDTWATSSVSPQLVTRTINEKFGLDHAAHQRLFPMAMRPQAHEIIRTWAFYTIVKAMHHQGTVPWRTICISGWCLASDGAKMSKSKGNVIDPNKLLDEYGSDPIRYWTGTSRLGNDTVLSPNTLNQGKRLVTKLWNAARLAHIALADVRIEPVSPAADIRAGTITHPLDQWLLGRLADALTRATEAFEAYEYAQALRTIEDFFWHIYCDNYLELVKFRTRLDGAPNPEQRSALHTLHHATMALIRLFAPFLPYVSEALHDIFSGRDAAGQATVHARGNWPKASDHADPELHRETGEAVLEIITGVRKVKSERDLSIRAPVADLIVAPAQQDRVARMEQLLRPVVEDIKQVVAAESFAVSPTIPQDLLSAAAEGEAIRVGLRMAAPVGED